MLKHRSFLLKSIIQEEDVPSKMRKQQGAFITIKNTIIRDNLNLNQMQILSRLLVMLMVTGALCDGLSYIYTQLNSLQTQVQQLLARQPQVIRIPPIDLSEPITLHQQTKSLALNVTLPPNKRVYGLLVQIYYYHTSSNSVAPGSHGYLSTKLKQRDDPLNIVQTSSQHFNWYANTATELEIIPWSKDRPSVLEAYLYDTYNTQSPGNPYGKNYYLIRLVGYLAY